MKTKRMILGLLVFILLMSQTSLGADVKVKYKRIMSVGKILDKHVGLPEKSEKNNTGTIAVKLKIDEKGIPTIVKIDGNNPTLQKHVETEIAKIDAKEFKAHAGGEYIVKINFRKE